MRTDFTDAQLSDPQLRLANGILRNCVHCGFCAPACPTYRLTGNELDGPRGRIWLIRDLLGGGGTSAASGDTSSEPSPALENGVVRHLDRCLGCLACMAACPSKVDYHGLIGLAREAVEKKVKRPFPERALRRILGRILPDPVSFKWLIRVARPVTWLRHLLPGRIGAALSLAARARPRKGIAPGVFPPEGQRRGRIVTITGCAQAVLAPAITEALTAIANRAGYEVVVLENAACCGALNEHLGQGDEARSLARKVVDGVIAEAEGDGCDAVIATASGCGTAMKGYGAKLVGDPDYAEKAARAAVLVHDAGEFLAGLALTFPARAAGPRIAWQAPCSLANGQGAAAFGAELLGRAGFEVVEPPEGPVCCGSAGTYNLMEPETADGLRAEKVRSLNGLAADAVASSNLGCMMQLASGLNAPVCHILELIDWAQGGRVPKSLVGKVEDW